MEDIVKKREEKLIKEGLNFIDTFEKYTKKNRPEIYKKYLIFKEEKINCFSDKWSRHMHVIEFIKNDIKERNLKFLDLYDEMFKEMEKYVNTFIPKVLLEKVDLDKIYKLVLFINEISVLPDQTRLNYVLKCKTFFRIQMLMNYDKYLLG